MLPNKLQPKDNSVAIFAVGAIGVIGFVVAMAMLNGCAAVKTVANNMAQCALDSLPQETISLVPAVETILTGGAANWQSQLEQLGKVGIGDVVCAVEKSIMDLDQKLPHGKVMGQVDPKISGGIARGQQFLAAKGVK